MCASKFEFKFVSNDVTNDATKSVNWNDRLPEIDSNHITVGSNVSPDFSLTNQVTLNRICVGTDIGPTIGSANHIAVIDNHVHARVKSDTVKLSPFKMMKT